MENSKVEDKLKQRVLHPVDRSGLRSSSDESSGSHPTFVHQDYPQQAPVHRSQPYYAEHGPPIDNRMNYDQAEEDYLNHQDLAWQRFRHYWRDLFAEFMGTCIMIIFGDGSVAQVTLSGNTSLPMADQSKGNYQSISWGWGIGVMFGVYVAGCAGGHLNPAITFVNCLYRGFPWKKWFPYACAQVSGCFCGAAIIYGNYKSAIDAYEGGASVRTVPGYSDTATAGVFCTYPQPFMTKTGQVFSEVIASAVLVFCIFALKDDSNLGAGNLTPLALLFLIFAIGATLGWETGYAVNLARDFGPRLFTYFVGYGPNVWRAGDYYFWVPMVCPFIGATFGGFLYDALIYTGESPLNKPWWGFQRYMHPSRKALKQAWHKGDNVPEEKSDTEADEVVKV